MENSKKISIFWFRRDLRLEDNAGLYHALKSGQKVLPIFIFDSEILTKLDDKHDARVSFIHREITRLKNELNHISSDLFVAYGKPIEIFKKLISTYHIAEVFTNHDYEKYAITRDNEIRNLLNTNGIAFYTYKDQCIFEKNEILSNTGTPYTVFTPYSRKWKEKLNDFYLKSYPTETYYSELLNISKLHLPSLQDMYFAKSSVDFPANSTELELIKNYKAKRDIPSIKGTSRLSVHLRFGTISIRKLAQMALPNSETWLNELIWRDFYFNILHHFPHITEGHSFRKVYDQIEWRNNIAEFEAWCTGNTGYPIVDAGMRELNTTGFMHNRVRMIVASFLCKHLLIDWRWGEAYFAKKLLDFDFSANNGGWQWASGSGCDAAPYFRVFSPKLQTEKFDPELKYIKKWVPEFQDFGYSKPIVDHDFARKRAIDTYKKYLG